MWWIVTIPFAFQGLLMTFDEWRFHIRRDLPLWERLGHPLDTLSFFIAILFVLIVPFEAGLVKWYVAIALFSTLLVTKDEFVHHEECVKEEQWVHAVLFTLHPIMLTLLGMIWPVIHGVELPRMMQTVLDNKEMLKLFVTTLGAFVFLFFLYQLIFWNIVWRKR